MNDKRDFFTPAGEKITLLNVDGMKAALYGDRVYLGLADAKDMPRGAKNYLMAGINRAGEPVLRLFLDGVCMCQGVPFHAV